MKRLYENESLARAPATGTSLIKSHEPAEATKA
jgi:hypothetical protein